VRIGELAELVGVTTRTVRHYHHVGLLPEPARSANGYRAYQLRDVVRLFRVRRLVELGLNLDEVADALTDDESRDLREIFVDLDAELALQEQEIRGRRHRIASLLAAEGDLSVSRDHAEVSTALGAVFGPDHPGLERERLVLGLVEPLSGAESGRIWDGYRSLLGDEQFAAQMRRLGERFEELADLAPDDPAVARLAEDARDVVGPAVLALAQEDAVGDGDPHAAERMLRAVSAGMAPAQTRCLELMWRHWQQASS
jgi:DNA-binding transcriptional MerR regulator